MCNAHIHVTRQISFEEVRGHQTTKDGREEKKKSVRLEKVKVNGKTEEKVETWKDGGGKGKMESLSVISTQFNHRFYLEPGSQTAETVMIIEIPFQV